MNRKSTISSVLPLILSNVTFTRSLLVVRRVCRNWNHLFCQSPLMEDLIYNVTSDKNGDSVRTFKKMTSGFALKHLRFRGLNMNQLFDYEEDNKFLGQFGKHHAPGLQTLVVDTCLLNPTVLFTLLSFSPKLRYFAVKNCPSIYRPDLSVIHWPFSFEQLEGNIAKIATLKLHENVITENHLCGFTHNMSSLISLQLASVEILPKNAIRDILKNNHKSLEELFLAGVHFTNKTITEGVREISKMPDMEKLQSLYFGRGNYHSDGHCYYLMCFLTKCPQLRRLTLAEATLAPDTLSDIPDRLVYLSLSNCDFTKGTFRSASWSNLRELEIKVSQGEVPSDVATEALKTLLGTVKPNLKRLELVGLPVGRDWLNAIIPEAHPSLRSLALIGMYDLGGNAMRSMFRNFVNLEALSLAHCDDIQDENLCMTNDGKADEALSNLKNLQYLNLSGTGIGVRTIDECILKLPKMQHLRLNSTKVSSLGIFRIITSTGKNDGLTLLRSLGIEGIPEKVSLRVLEFYNAQAPRVAISCDLIIYNEESESQE